METKPVIRNYYIIHCVWPPFTFRASGDKSGPPSFPDAETEGPGLVGEDDEASDKEEEEVVECAEEEEEHLGEKAMDEVCAGVEELSLTEQEEEKEEQGNEEEEENQEAQKTPQGTTFSGISHTWWSTFLTPVLKKSHQSLSQFWKLIDKFWARHIM